MDLLSLMLLQEGIYTTALENEDIDPTEVYEGILKKLRGEE